MCNIILLKVKHAGMSLTILFYDMMYISLKNITNTMYILLSVVYIYI
jgi:hypothetical protein